MVIPGQIVTEKNEISTGTMFIQIVNDYNGYSIWPMKYKIIDK